MMGTFFSVFSTIFMPLTSGGVPSTTFFIDDLGGMPPAESVCLSRTRALQCYTCDQLSSSHVFVFK
ncbi:hypothetical protein Taro_038787 [Colocasia esculenta]|uniref:Secreted protein n=1 Tax=Colocasia esculenta TaxID=4460 RepID=A0A843WGV6_COLES|nr:hypothetical protein [Colocasia esculenta]